MPRLIVRFPMHLRKLRQYIHRPDTGLSPGCRDEDLGDFSTCSPWLGFFVAAIAWMSNDYRLLTEPHKYFSLIMKDGETY
jgi:hypothetical protein